MLLRVKYLELHLRVLRGEQGREARGPPSGGPNVETARGRRRAGTAPRRDKSSEGRWNPRSASGAKQTRKVTRGVNRREAEKARGRNVARRQPRAKWTQVTEGAEGARNLKGGTRAGNGEGGIEGVL
jgi:hypothetical protein